MARVVREATPPNSKRPDEGTLLSLAYDDGKAINPRVAQKVGRIVNLTLTHAAETDWQIVATIFVGNASMDNRSATTDLARSNSINRDYVLALGGVGGIAFALLVGPHLIETFKEVQAC